MQFFLCTFWTHFFLDWTYFSTCSWYIYLQHSLWTLTFSSWLYQRLLYFNTRTALRNGRALLFTHLVFWPLLIGENDRGLLVDWLFNRFRKDEFCVHFKVLQSSNWRRSLRNRWFPYFKALCRLDPFLPIENLNKALRQILLPLLFCFLLTLLSCLPYRHRLAIDVSNRLQFRWTLFFVLTHSLSNSVVFIIIIVQMFHKGFESLLWHFWLFMFRGISLSNYNILSRTST